MVTIYSKIFQLYFYVQHISDPLQFSQRQSKFKIHLITNTNID